MPIYDNNGTVNNEIMAIYDNDGTTNYLICEDSSVDFSAATATAADVLSGKTFYSGDKELKTGTLITTAKYTAHRSSYSNAVGGLTAGKIYLVVCAYEWTDGIYVTGGATVLASLGTMDHINERITLFVVKATSSTISVNNPWNDYMCVCAVPLN